MEKAIQKHSKGGEEKATTPTLGSKREQGNGKGQQLSSQWHQQTEQKEQEKEDEEDTAKRSEAAEAERKENALREADAKKKCS